MEDQIYERYVQIKIDRSATRKLCPFEVQKFFKEELDLLEDDVQAEKGYIVEVKSVHQFRTVMQLKSIFEIPCAAVEDSPAVRMYNSARGLVYINEYDITDTAKFEEGLKRDYNICSVKATFWIKAKNVNASAFLITFAQSQLSSYIKMPGERPCIQIYPQRVKPLFCTKCLEYTHTEKRCRNSERCRLCAEAHKSTECGQRVPKWYHCGE